MRELYRVWPSSLTDEKINNIIEVAFENSQLNARTFLSKDVVTDVRVSSIRWIASPEIKKILWSYVRRANYNTFDIEVDNKCEVQYTEYRASECGHYDWHQDVHWNGTAIEDRKISVTVQLSDSDSYQGGDFEFDEIKTNADFRSKGTVLVFPSYLRHRILPVSLGVRQSLVAWFMGPRWR